MKRCKNYINGAWTESVSGNAAPTFNPATGEELAQVVVSTPEDVDRAVAAAHTSFYETREWRDMDSQTRGDFLLRIADLIAEAREELAYLDAVDMGKPLREAEGDVDDAIKYGFGMRLGVSGPMEVIDRGGLDLTYSIHKYLFPHIESSAEPSKLMVQLMDEGKLGFKTGEGFQLWSPGQVKASNETLTRGLIQVSRALGRL